MHRDLPADYRDEMNTAPEGAALQLLLAARTGGVTPAGGRQPSAAGYGIVKAPVPAIVW